MDSMGVGSIGMAPLRSQFDSEHVLRIHVSFDLICPETRVRAWMAPQTTYLPRAWGTRSQAQQQWLGLLRAIDRGFEDTASVVYVPAPVRMAVAPFVLVALLSFMLLILQAVFKHISVISALAVVVPLVGTLAAISYFLRMTRRVFLAALVTHLEGVVLPRLSQANPDLTFRVERVDGSRGQLDLVIRGRGLGMEYAARPQGDLPALMPDRDSIWKVVYPSPISVQCEMNFQSAAIDVLEPDSVLKGRRIGDNWVRLAGQSGFVAIRLLDGLAALKLLKEEIRCPNGHLLELVIVSETYLFCAVCQQRCQRDDSASRCKQCSYHLCSKCGIKDEDLRDDDPEADVW